MIHYYYVKTSVAKRICAAERYEAKNQERTQRIPKRIRPTDT